MNDLENTLTGIEEKVRVIIGQRNALMEDLGRMRATCKELEETIEKQHIIINNLEEKNNFLKLRNTLTQKGDSTEIKLKINQLIRNIDRSLELLNKV